MVQGVVAWFTGQRPEFFDPKFVSQGEGREGEQRLLLFFSNYHILLAFSNSDKSINIRSRNS